MIWFHVNRTATIICVLFFFIFITRRGVDAPIQALLLHIIARNLARFPSPSRLLLQTLQTVWTDTSYFTLKNKFTQILYTCSFAARRFSSSDSISELDLSGRRASGQGSKDTDSPKHATPPGTPPPPYWRPASPLVEDSNGCEVLTPLFEHFFTMKHSFTLSFFYISVTDNNFRHSQHHPPGFTRSALHGWRNPAEYFVHGRRRFLWPWNGSISHVTKVMKVS